MNRVTEEKFPERDYLQLVAGLVLHAASAGLLAFDAAQRAGRAEKLLARFAAMNVEGEVVARALNEWLKAELLEPVTKCLHQVAVEGLDRDELFKRAATLGEAAAARLFFDRHTVN